MHRLLWVFFLVTNAAVAAEPHNLILFVPDGLRALMVNATTTPTMNEMKGNGVYFENNHSAYPTLTMPNASVFSTGHVLGDTGIFSNSIYTKEVVHQAHDTTTPFLENDDIIDELENQYDGHLMRFSALLEEAQHHGFNTAVIGKVGPTKLFHPTITQGMFPILIDDMTGHNTSTLPQPLIDLLNQNQLPLITPGRGSNGQSGNAMTPGTLTNNRDQQQYFVDVATKVILPYLNHQHKPFVLVYWSRDPDGTQHNQGDSLQQVVPGINGPTSLSAITNADNNLHQLMNALITLGLDKNTNIVVAADHGFSTIWKESQTSYSASQSYTDVATHQLPPGFLAIDLSHGLGLPLYDANQTDHLVVAHEHPIAGNGLIGEDSSHPWIRVVANGGSDLIYVDHPASKKEIEKIITLLFHEDYVSGVFVDDKLGRYPGTLTLSDIGLDGQANTPRPAMVVNFRSSYSACRQPITCSVEIADTVLQQGQGMHGNFNRADTYPFMAAIGPDFKTHYTDLIPSSNVDMGMTLRALLGLTGSSNNNHVGRVLEEALLGGKEPLFNHVKKVSDPGLGGKQTVLNIQKVGSHSYLDSGGFPGNTLGLY
ncbi:type I phosphodiesterase / nucleotide pyrophosphatase [Ferrovum sp. JA12]|uniref:alkaline phosphatase family protein n=1 Tax=Ferrovum sp. JA12 TaxID=1356299 RepID=UPI00070276E4|nr:alkaline phosphatase family protein [Ferrovum sp. JA12]KRH78953.1 type I phosphodiesterase / nucleotide pyrophosphatase [Ferrovum sp. JA12]